MCGSDNIPQDGKGEAAFTLTFKNDNLWALGS